MPTRRITFFGAVILLATLTACVYADRPRRAHHDSDRDRGRVYGSEQLFQTARDIERLAGRLKHEAKDDQRHWRLRGEDLDRIERINAAAQKFWDQVRKYRGDPRHIDEEYRRLVDRMAEAGRAIGYFSAGTQRDYNQLWSLVQDLGYIQAEADRRYH